MGEGEKKLKKLTFLNQLGFGEVVFNRKMPNNSVLSNIRSISFSDKRKLEIDSTGFHKVIGEADFFCNQSCPVAGGFHF